MSVPLHFQTLAELAERLAKREISSLELTRAVIARTEAVETSVRAFNSRDAADALALALTHAQESGRYSLVPRKKI